MKRNRSNLFEPLSVGEYPIKRLAAMYYKRQTRIDGKRELKIPGGALLVHASAEIGSKSVKPAFSYRGDTERRDQFLKKTPFDF